MPYNAMLMRILTASAVAMLLLVPAGVAQSVCEDLPGGGEPQMACPAIDPQLSPVYQRIERYARIASKHRLCGLASYYSTSLDGTLTANGERFHQHDGKSFGEAWKYEGTRF